MITLKMSRLSFFDSKVVLRAVDRSKRKAQSKLGSYMRRSARQLLRKRKRSARHGEPPSMHVGFIKRFLFFAWDSVSESVVIGPALIVGKSLRNDTVPHLMEAGGMIGKRGKTRNYAPHPFMGPTLIKEKNNDRLSQAWKDAVTR